LYNNLAWCCLLLNKLEEADKYSKLAIAKHQNTNHVRGTRGSVLIELGQYALGKQILLKDVDFNFPNSHTLTASLYLALAFQELKEPKESLKYIQFVHANVQLLDLDEKALYDRIVSRLNKG
jgi:tetratricopeptide (TPR) repeat protein